MDIPPSVYKVAKYVVVGYILYLILSSLFTKQGSPTMPWDMTSSSPFFGDSDPYPPAVAPVSSSYGEDLSAIEDPGPVSTPLSLASRHGLGGGQLVGSQSKKLGGSTFKFAGKKVPVPGLQDHFYEWNAPNNPKLIAPTKPAPKPASIKAKSGPTPIAPAQKLVGPTKKLKASLPSDNFLTSEQIVVENRNGEIIQAR